MCDPGRSWEDKNVVRNEDSGFTAHEVSLENKDTIGN